MRAFCSFCLVSVMIAAPATAGDTPLFQWTRSIQFESELEEDVIAIALDTDVYRVTQASLADVRVTNADGAYVPFLLKKQTIQRDRVVRRTWAARDVDLKPLEEGALEIHVRLDKDDPQPTGLTLVTPLRNFEQRVSVFEDDETDPLVTDALVYDYSRFMDVSRHNILLPENSARSFRIVVGSLTAGQESELLELTRRLSGGEELEQQERTRIQRRPFRIDRVEFYLDEARSKVAGDELVRRPVLRFEAEEDLDEKETVIEVRTSREPVTKFHLETADRNFSRRVRVLVPETRGIRTIWQEVGHGTVSRFTFRDISEESLVISVPETRDEHFRIIIENRDSPPVNVDAIVSEGPVHELVCLVPASAELQLVYGSEDIEEPSYDVASIRAALKSTKQTTAVTLGKPVALRDIDDAAPVDLRDAVNNPVVVGIVVVVLVALLAVALVGAGRRIDALEPDGDATDSPEPDGSGGA